MRPVRSLMTVFITDVREAAPRLRMIVRVLGIPARYWGSDMEFTATLRIILGRLRWWVLVRSIWAMDGLSVLCIFWEI